MTESVFDRDLFNILTTALLDTTDNVVDFSLHANIKRMLNAETKDLKDLIREFLDYCVRYSMATGYVISLYNDFWLELGGKEDDPTPWRDSMS